MTLNDRTGYHENGQRRSAVANGVGAEPQHPDGHPARGHLTGAPLKDGSLKDGSLKDGSLKDGPLTDDRPPEGLHSGGHQPARHPLAARALLDWLCHSASTLANVTPRPPSRVKVRHGDAAVEVEWSASAAPPPREAPPPGPGPSSEVAGAVGPTGNAAAMPPGHLTVTEDRLVHVRAPSVGTFYHAPEPGAPPFVAVGDVIRPGQPVGVLEVMKMMSTIESDVAGRVVEVMVPDATSVEFHECLLAVEPPGGAAGER